MEDWGRIRHDRHGVEEPVRGNGTSADGRRDVKLDTGDMDMGETDALTSESLWGEMVQVVCGPTPLLWQQSKSKVIPEEYRKYTLIEFGPQGDYYISSKLRKLFRETRDA